MDHLSKILEYCSSLWTGRRPTLPLTYCQIFKAFPLTELIQMFYFSPTVRAMKKAERREYALDLEDEKDFLDTQLGQLRK